MPLFLEIGSPAWAGIDLRINHLVLQNRGLPRVGGDRPLEAQRETSGLRAPPRGRG